MQIFPPREEWYNRQQRLQQKLIQDGLKGCLISQNVGIYYFTGSMQTGYLFMPADGDPTYYVRRSIARAFKESQVRTVELGSLRQFGKQLESDYPSVFISESDNPLLIGADMDVMPAQLYVRLAEAIPQAQLKDGSALLRNVRSVKSPYEIDCISRAAEVAAAALEEGIAALQEDMTELELIAIIENAMRKRGHIGLMRMRGYNQEIMTGVVSAGEAAAEPTYFDGPAGGRGLSPAAPQSVSLRPIGRNETILIDIGCCIDGYTIDQTRTAVIGELPSELQAAYETAEAIIRRSEQLLRPGTKPEQLYAQALEMAEAAGLSEHFMGFGRDQVKFLGHGIGLEIDEWPVLARGFQDPLEPGMTLAVEPKFTFPGLGVVGIENTYLITETGCRPLTQSPERIYTIQI
ncbi:M24 family metallopeptidase [Cohnella silvisoli]|uniref:Xaa-Pro peptidase family protein n=1 Tax=Cohnella silvisoli TaxID=2873699 RepID=A0ABV1L333_9BACL|nr:Xaa-Pro peptidase family protein [Cohnella silvisoli]MCD9026074.1 Xaa-Pro peptidase family protein [Cohnella silvisoli]